MARAYGLTNEAQSVGWRIVVSGGVVFHWIHLCFLSNPWHLYPVSPLVAGSRCVCGREDIYHQKWAMGVDSTFGVGAVENPRMLPWFLRQVHGEAG